MLCVISVGNIFARNRIKSDTALYYVFSLCFFSFLFQFFIAYHHSKTMLSVIERIVRTNCVICDARAYSDVICDACERQSRNDFYLLLLTNMKDEAGSYEDLKSKCIDMHDAIDHHPMITEPRQVFDPLVDSVDSHSKHLMENYTDILNRDAVPVNVAGDGDCLFHSIHSFYPELSTDEIRARCVDELCLHEQYYSAIISEMGLDLVDDESVEEHVLRILNSQQYCGVLTLASLSSVLMRPIRSIYPHVNDEDRYFEVLNTTFFPRSTDLTAEEDDSLKIMWSGPEKKSGQDWRPNHFVPLLAPKQHITMTIPINSIDHSVDTLNIRATQTDESNFEMVDSNVNEDQVEDEVEDDIPDQSFQVTFDSRYLFSDGSVVIKEILDAVKSNHVDDSPPKEVTYPSKFMVKSTYENRLSVGKDGNGAWMQTSSSETTFVLTTKETYQIVRRDVKGQYHYSERIGRQYAQHLVQEKDVLTLKRFAILFFLFIYLPTTKLTQHVFLIDIFINSQLRKI